MYLNLLFLKLVNCNHICLVLSFIFFCHRVKKNMLESLEFMKNQFLWAPSIHKFSYMMNYETENYFIKRNIHEIRSYERTKSIRSTITCIKILLIPQYGLRYIFKKIQLTLTVRFLY